MTPYFRERFTDRKNTITDYRNFKPGRTRFLMTLQTVSGRSIRPGKGSFAAKAAQLRIVRREATYSPIPACPRRFNVNAAMASRTR
ncbi:hypothetical protein D3C71_2099830 [compost metagenome]